MRRALALGLLAALLAVPAAFAHASSRRATVQFQTVAHVGAGALYVTVAPGEPGTIYVVRQGGQVAAVTGSKVRVFANVASKISSGGERGLLSLAFNPGYRRNHLVYLSYTDTLGDSRVVRYRTNGRTLLPRTAKAILYVKQPFSNHNGGQLQFGPDGKLYVGYGDGGSGGDPGNRAQNTGTKLGKLLRLDVTKAKAVWQMVGLGLRNPWRFSFDRKTDDLWIGDVGQDTWEEIDYVPHAAFKPLLNFGWSVYEGDAKFKDEAVGPGTLTQPVYVYKHGSAGCSVTGGYVYRGSAVPALAGRYVFGDFCSGAIWSGVIGGGALTDVRQEGKVSQPAGFGEDASGELYVAGLDGTVYKLAQA